MTVWLVVYDVAFEGGECMSVWSTREAAEAERDRLTNRHMTYAVEERTIDQPFIDGSSTAWRGPDMGAVVDHMQHGPPKSPLVEHPPKSK